MPGTPSPLKLGFQRNSYIRVSCDNDHQNSTLEVEQTTQLITDPDPVTEKESDPPPSAVAPGVSYINEGEDDQMEVYGYSKSVSKTIFTWVCIVATAGILRLVFHWYPHWFLQATHSRCHLSVSDRVLLVEQYQKKHKCYFVKTVSIITAQDLFNSDSESWDGQSLNDVEGDRSSVKGRLSIHISGGHFKEYDMLRIFHCKKLCYIWSDEREEFLQLRGLDKGVITANLHQSQGLSQYNQKLRRAVYGRNEIVVPVRTVLTLLFLEVLNPFYVFQLFSFILWFINDYQYYAIAILLMSSFGITMSIIQTRKNQHKLRSTVHSSDVITVVRSPSDKTDVIPTEQLVPGDILLVPPHGCVMHCDAVLLAGNCIVNESMLTGESVPVTKTPLPCTQDLYESKEHAKHTLFCGTHIIQTRYYGSDRVLAVVIRTGFSTAKGSLVRSIMYPPPVDFKFEQDSYKFVMLLAGVASVGFLYTVVSKVYRGIRFSAIVLNSLDLITIAVPPALPAAMTVGRYYAQRRLEEKEIYCISPRTINVSGSIDCVCFDKTGTLTEDGMDMWGVIPICEQKFEVPVKLVSAMQIDKLLIGLATCHSLTIIDNKISGDPLDLKMFECTNWALEEPEINDNTKFDIMSPTVVRPRHTNKMAELGDELGVEVGILRQFPFSSSLQRMSVITRCLGTSQLEAYCKGSPEMIVSLSLPETIPLDFSSVLEKYTQEGYRVIAIASKELRKVSYAKVQRLTREEVESKLNFLGLIVMENRLKPETSGIIQMLSQANIRTIMVTGDNMLTSLCVARDCGVVPATQRVVIVEGLAAQQGMDAQLCFTRSSYSGGPQASMVNDADSSDLKNSSNVTSFEAFACPTPDMSPFDKPTVDSYSFALTGHTWSIIRAHCPEVIPRIITRGAVFARMSPEQKQQLVQELQGLGYYVAMCGDGANDCGALKAAHTGISLSEAESSVASPFTSKQANISCVPHVIREGRAALVTSFGIFKYMAAYSLTQFVSVMILYSIDTNLGDKQFLYIDLFLITIFAFFFGRTEAYSGPLVKSPPILSLVSLAPILSVVSQVTLVILMQIIGFFLIQQTDGYIPFKPKISEEIVGSYENYAIFTVSSFQYIILAVVFSKGAPYRKPLFTNYGFLISLVVMTAITLYIVLDPFKFLRDILVLLLPPMSFRLVLVGLAISNLVIACVIEYFIIDYVLIKKTNCKCKDKDKAGCKYLEVERELREDPSWPPFTTKPPVTESVKSDEKPPRSPVEIAEVGNDLQSQGFTTHLRIGSLPRVRVSSAIEVTLDPSTLFVPKRRHYSETESRNGAFHTHSLTNDVHTLPQNNIQDIHLKFDKNEPPSVCNTQNDSVVILTLTAKFQMAATTWSEIRKSTRNIDR